jgi:glycogen operon protein
MVASVRDRFLGSPDIYGDRDSEAGASINFITAHDGFTLNDLVSYEQKHNEANGENNRDGTDHNLSWNGGVEGPTDDPGIERLRRRQIRNFLALDLLAIGTPMVLMGDEVRRTQGGNNNAYAHSDPSTWFDWSGLDRHADLHRFTKTLIRVRRRLAKVLGLSDDRDFLDLLRDASYEWSGVVVGQPDAGYESRSIALTFQADRWAIHLIFNAYWEPLEFELPTPEVDSDGWQRIIDTSLESPEDIVSSLGEAPIVGPATYLAEGRSVILLVARQLAEGTSRGSDG